MVNDHEVLNKIPQRCLNWRTATDHERWSNNSIWLIYSINFSYRICKERRCASITNHEETVASYNSCCGRWRGRNGGHYLDDNWYIDHKFTLTLTDTYTHIYINNCNNSKQKKAATRIAKENMNSSPLHLHRNGETLRKGNDKSRGFVDLQASEYFEFRLILADAHPRVGRLRARRGQQLADASPHRQHGSVHRPPSERISALPLSSSPIFACGARTTVRLWVRVRVLLEIVLLIHHCFCSL
jgi:hypothetical protein